MCDNVGQSEQKDNNMFEIAGYALWIGAGALGLLLAKDKPVPGSEIMALMFGPIYLMMVFATRWLKV